MTQNPKCEWLSFVKRKVRSRVDLSRWEWDGASLPLIFGSLVAHLLPPFTFVASFHRGNTKKVPNVFLLRGNRRRSRYIRKEKKQLLQISKDERRWRGECSLVEERWFDSRYPLFWCLSPLFLKSTIRRTTRCFGKWFRYTITQRLAGSRNKWGVIKVSS